MKAYAFVPAKSSSSRLPGKNMKILAGERLFIRALKTLLRCVEIDKVFLDSDSEEMFSLIDYLPAQAMRRDPSLCDNSTDGHALFMNEVRSYPDADIYVQLLCTSPFIDPGTIDAALKKLKASEEYDSAILTRREKLYLWENGDPVYGRGKIPNSVDLPTSVMESMGLYIHKKPSALKLNARYGLKPLFIEGSPLECLDINTPEDFQLAQAVADGLLRDENRRFGMLKNFIDSALLADVLDDLRAKTGRECGKVIPGFRSNMENARLLGRARTLRLRALRPGEDFRGIYNALQTYECMADNDIICVENEIPEFAYFGELNARLAIRAGASGAIVNGATRDVKGTRDLNFPVFSRSLNPQDVRRRAVMDYADKPIHFGGALVSPGDLVFADAQAAVIIYPPHEKEVLARAVAARNNEMLIANDITERKGMEEEGVN